MTPYTPPRPARRKAGQPAADSEFEKKHPRGSGSQGGQFVRKGSSGSEVTGAQRRLGVAADGAFGRQTEKAVRRFQKKNGLEVDGIIGAQTAAAFRGATAKPGALSATDLKFLAKLSKKGKKKMKESATPSVMGALLAGRSRRNAESEAELREVYEGDPPQDALGREARTLHGSGSLYLGAGIGASKKDVEDTVSFIVTDRKTEVTSHATALGATAHAYELAGKSKDPDSPGGTEAITDPAIAARVREVDGMIASEERRVARYQRELSAANRRPLASFGNMGADDNSWRQRSLAEARANLRRFRSERRVLLDRNAPSK